MSAPQPFLDIPGLGRLAFDPDREWYLSAPLHLAALGHSGRIAMPIPDQPVAHYHAAAIRLLTGDSVLPAAAPHVYAYYVDVKNLYAAEEEWDFEIPTPQEVWAHVELGDLAILSRRSKDGQVYASIECECDWEPEHGLQLVLLHGGTVKKVGPYDSHLSNADAYARAELEEVVYQGLD